MIPSDISKRLKEISKSNNLPSLVKQELFQLLKESYQEGFDRGLYRHGEETVFIGQLSDMTVQQLANLIGTKND
jgi:hypothetical protein